MCRLETYVTAHNDLFSRVINVMEEEFVQILRRQALLGRAIIRTENEIFREPLALDICLGRGVGVGSRSDPNDCLRQTCSPSAATPPSSTCRSA